MQSEPTAAIQRPLEVAKFEEELCLGTVHPTRRFRNESPLPIHMASPGLELSVPYVNSSWEKKEVD